MHRLACQFLTLTLFCASMGMAQAQTTLAAGAAQLLTTPKGGDRAAPTAHGREGVMRQRAVPTNQWYSSLLFSQEPQALYAQPLTGRATAQGFEMSLPLKSVIPTERKDNEIHYPHRSALKVRPTAFEPAVGRTFNAGRWG